MEKKTTRNWTAEETNLFCSILADLVTTFIFTLEQNTNFEHHVSDTNEGMDGICSNSADTLLSDFFRQEGEENKEVDEGEGMVVEWMRKMTTTLWKIDNSH